jgi:hypothetical protein
MYKKVELSWIDISSYSGWNDKNDILNKFCTECLVHQLGYIIDENSEYIIITDTYIFSIEGMIGNCTKIPKSVIKKIKFL